jgi:hypothetical protein
VRIFTVGYQAGWKPAGLQQAIDLLGATVLDIRLRPWSKVEEWQQGQLEVALSSYVHVIALGNLNYRGGPIKLKNERGGIARAVRVLEFGPVILLCGCWNAETCHRTVVAERLARAAGETQWMDLGKPKKPAGPKPAQLSLF